MPESATIRKRLGRIAREVIAPAVWCYVTIKLLVFDIDQALLQSAAPTYLWLIDYKFFVFLAATVVLLLALGPGELFILGAFVLAYPLVLVFWKIPKRFYRQWPIVVVFLPAVGAALMRLWSTFLLYSIGAFGALFILVSATPVLVLVGIACLIPLLVVHLTRSLRKAYAASLLTQLIDLLGKLRHAIESGTFVPWDQKPPTANAPDSTPSTTPSATPSSTTDPRQIAYSSHWFTEVVAERVKTVARRRHYDLYLLVSWFYTVLLTAVTFALVHFGLHKALAGSYADAQGARFWSFVGYSLGILTTSNVSKISPLSTAANIATYAEVLCSVVILVILVFSILTAAREAFRENLDDLAGAINGVGTALESRIRSQFQLTVVELEVALLADMPAYVNSLRKVRGLPELPAGSVPHSTSLGDGGGRDGAA